MEPMSWLNQSSCDRSVEPRVMQGGPPGAMPGFSGGPNQAGPQEGGEHNGQGHHPGKREGRGGGHSRGKARGRGDRGRGGRFAYAANNSSGAGLFSLSPVLRHFAKAC